MKFSIKTLVDLENYELIKRMQASKELSFVILDNNFKIQSKSISNDYSFLGLRLKSSISNRMSKSHFDCLNNMKHSEIHHIDLSKNGREVSSVAVCCESGVLILIGDAYSSLNKSVDGIQSKMSGYDVCLKRNWETEFPDREKADSELLINHLSRVIESHKFINSSSVANVSYAISVIVNEINSSFENKLEYCPNQKELFVQGIENDFALVLVMILGFCRYNDKDGKVSIEITDDENEISLYIKFLPHCLDERIFKFIAFRSKKAFEENGAGAFLIYGIKLISEYNLWDFSVNQNPDGALIFKLKMPAASLSDGFVLSDAFTKYVSELLEAFLKYFS